MRRVGCVAPTLHYTTTGKPLFYQTYILHSNITINFEQAPDVPPADDGLPKEIPAPNLHGPAEVD